MISFLSCWPRISPPPHPSFHIPRSSTPCHFPHQFFLPSFPPSPSLSLPLFLFISPLFVSMSLSPSFRSLSYFLYLALLVVLSACLPDCLSLSLSIFLSCSISRSHSNCLSRSFSLSLHLSLPSLLRTVPGGFHPLSF